MASSKLSSVAFPGEDTETKKENGGNSTNPSIVRFLPDGKVDTLAPDEADDQPDELSADAREQIKNLAISLQKSGLQESRMSQFAFEPVSMPATRFPSRDSDASPGPGSGTGTPSTLAAPGGHHASISSALHSPPLTPAGSTDAKVLQIPAPGRSQAAITPQTSPPFDGQGRALSQSISPGHTVSRPSSSGEQTSARQTSLSDQSQKESKKLQQPQQAPRFEIAQAGSSSPQDESPVRTPVSGSRASSPAPGSKGEQHRHFGSTGKGSLAPAIAAAAEKLPRPGSSDHTTDKRASFFGKKEAHATATAVAPNEHGDIDGSKKQGSMSELKRFFRFGHRHKGSSTPSTRESHSSSHASKKAAKSTGTHTPPHQLPPQAVPFHDEHGLEAKYGKFGKVLGSGAGGSVRLLKRSSDGVTFAVKQFRDRHNWESEKDYSKKVTAEFCIGSTLHHGNIIETMDIIQENHRWYEVMEYAPYDLFAIVMTGKMSREEIACCFLQIVNGVSYLHSMGLAHRDLKLDNVVVSERGIMKIIDFGSATVFRYPFEDEIVLASGIVGSDPYLAPEVYDDRKYDPTGTDIWSLAIIFCCMSLRRFPWKQPRLVDNSYKLFAAPPTPGTPTSDAQPRRVSEIAPPPPSETDSGHGQHQHSHHHHHHHSEESDRRPSYASDKQEVIRGPWRLLRILPRESRYIIGRMLRVDPQERARMDEVLEDDWVLSSQVCSQDVTGQVHRMENHTHTLEPGNGQGPPGKG